MQEFLDKIIFSSGGWSISLAQLLLSGLVIIISAVILKIVSSSTRLTSYFNSSVIEEKQQKNLRKIIFWLVFLAAIYYSLRILKINSTFYVRNDYNLTLILILKGLIILQAARFFDWVISNIIIHKYFVKRDTPDPKKAIESKADERYASRTVQFIVYVAAVFLLMKNLNLDYTLFSTEVKNAEGVTVDVAFKATKIISAFLIIMIARLVVWLMVELFLYGIYNRRGIDKGSQYAINQLIKYFIYIIAFLVALDYVGINMTVIWTGAAALLVGIGLGLQQTFNDFISGIVLLFERTTSVGDILEFDGKVGQVKKIGMRASTIETRNNMNVVVPNSKLVNENVTNWSHLQNRVRFEIPIGVAYGSDTALVKKILIEIASAHKEVLKHPKSFVRFLNFGNSSLDFNLFFFSKNYLFIEDVKSDLRFQIDKKFREEGVTVPFPQMDIWHRNESKP